MQQTIHVQILPWRCCWSFNGEVQMQAFKFSFYHFFTLKFKFSLTYLLLLLLVYRCRKATTKMMCMKCLIIQPIGPICSTVSCHDFSMARYYCRICKFFDDERWYNPNCLLLSLLFSWLLQVHFLQKYFCFYLRTSHERNIINFLDKKEPYGINTNHMAEILPGWNVAPGAYQKSYLCIYDKPVRVMLTYLWQSGLY